MKKSLTTTKTNSISYANRSSSSWPSSSASSSPSPALPSASYSHLDPKCQRRNKNKKSTLYVDLQYPPQRKQMKATTTTMTTTTLINKLHKRRGRDSSAAQKLSAFSLSPCSPPLPPLSKVLFLSPKLLLLLSLMSLACLLVPGVSTQEQQIYESPQHTTVNEGESVQLVCLVKNKQGPGFWCSKFGMGGMHCSPPKPNGQIGSDARYRMIGKDGNMTLEISDVSVTDDAPFVCQIGGFYAAGIRHKTKISKTANLTVNVAPSAPVIFGSELNNSSSTPSSSSSSAAAAASSSSSSTNSSSSLEVEARVRTNVTCLVGRGKPAASVTWQKCRVESCQDSDWIDIRDGDRYSVDYSTAPLTNDSTSKDRKLLSASSVLSWIPEAKEDHNNKIRCLATNAFLQRANLPPLIENKVISVKYPPIVSLTSTDNGFREGDVVTFNCHAAAHPSVSGFRWVLSDPSPTPSSYSSSSFSSSSNAAALLDQLATASTANPTLTLRIERSLFGRNLSCEASNAVGVSKASMFLSFNFAPIISIPAGPVLAADEGENVELRCDVSSFPVAGEVTWISPEGLSDRTPMGQLFEVPKIQERQFGNWTCSVEIPTYFPKQKTVEIHRKSLPESLTPRQQEAGQEEEEGEILCTFVSVPLPEPVATSSEQNKHYVTWRKTNGEEIKLFQRDSITDGKFVSSRLLPPPPLRRFHSSDFGEYECFIANEKGNVSAIVAFDATPPLTLHMIAAIGAGAGIVVLLLLVGVVIFCCRRGKHDSDSDDGKKSIHSNGKRSKPEITVEYGIRNGGADINRDAWATNAGGSSRPVGGGGGGSGGGGSGGGDCWTGNGDLETSIHPTYGHTDAGFTSDYADMGYKKPNGSLNGNYQHFSPQTTASPTLVDASNNPLKIRPPPEFNPCPPGMGLTGLEEYPDTGYNSYDRHAGINGGVAINGILHHAYPCSIPYDSHDPTYGATHHHHPHHHHLDGGVNLGNGIGVHLPAPPHGTYVVTSLGGINTPNGANNPYGSLSRPPPCPPLRTIHINGGTIPEGIPLGVGVGGGSSSHHSGSVSPGGGGSAGTPPVEDGGPSSPNGSILTDSGQGSKMSGSHASKSPQGRLSTHV